MPIHSGLWAVCFSTRLAMEFFHRFMVFTCPFEFLWPKINLFQTHLSWFLSLMNWRNMFFSLMNWRKMVGQPVNCGKTLFTDSTHVQILMNYCWAFPHWGWGIAFFFKHWTKIIFIGKLWALWAILKEVINGVYCSFHFFVFVGSSSYKWRNDDLIRK